MVEKLSFDPDTMVEKLSFDPDKVEVLTRVSDVDMSS